MKKRTRAVQSARRKNSRAFWFSYHAPPWLRDSEWKDSEYSYARHLHEVRDAGAFAYLSSVLFSCGCNFGGLLLNLPASQFQKAEADSPPEFRRGDILCLSTRPPLHDHMGKKQAREDRGIEASGTPLEECVFSTLCHHFFLHCSRKNVTLNDQLAKAARSFDKNLSSWCESDFWQNEFSSRPNQAACYDPDAVSSTGKPSEGYTAGYVFVVPRLLDQGRFQSPRLLGLFGMGGPETLTLARLLTKARTAKLQEFIFSPHPRILIVQWPVPKPPSNANSVAGVAKLPERPSSVEFLEKISPIVVLDAQCVGEIRPQWRQLRKFGTKIFS